MNKASIVASLIAVVTFVGNQCVRRRQFRDSTSRGTKNKEGRPGDFLWIVEKSRAVTKLSKSGMLVGRALPADHQSIENSRRMNLGVPVAAYTPWP